MRRPYPTSHPSAHGAIQGERVTAVAWHWKTFRTNASGTPDADSLHYSWLSPDRTGGSPYKLVTGEWFGTATGARVVRHQLNPTSAATNPGLLSMSGGKTVIQDAYAASHYVGLRGGMSWTDGTGLLTFAFHKLCASPTRRS